MRVALLSLSLATSGNQIVQFEARMQKSVKILEMHEDTDTRSQLFQIHELDPLYKIDRIVYREKSRYGWFKEISPELYFERVKKLGTVLSLAKPFCADQPRVEKISTS